MAVSERVRLIKAIEYIAEYIEHADIISDPDSDRCDLHPDSLYEELFALEKYLAMKGRK